MEASKYQDLQFANWMLRKADGIIFSLDAGWLETQEEP